MSFLDSGDSAWALGPASSSMDAAAVTLTEDGPSWVLSSRRAVLAALERTGLVFDSLISRSVYVGAWKVGSSRFFLKCYCC